MTISQKILLMIKQFYLNSSSLLFKCLQYLY